MVRVDIYDIIIDIITPFEFLDIQDVIRIYANLVNLSGSSRFGSEFFCVWLRIIRIGTPYVLQ